jgi:protein-disulfide isomerase
MRNILSVIACFGVAAFTLVSTAQAQDAVPVVTPDDYVLGKADAPVTIFEYASMTCPHCAAFARDTLPKVKTNWIETGKAKLVFRDYPLDRIALMASVAARCAPNDRYFAFIESFFDSQDNWARASDPIAALKGIARLGGMSGETFDKCIANDELQRKVVDGESKAKASFAVDSTPTFFIESVGGSTRLVGELPYEEFEKELNKALPKS